MRQELLHKFFEGTATIQEEMDIREWMESSEENKKHFFLERQLFDASLIMEYQKVPVNPKKRRGQYRLFKEFIKIASIILLTLGTTTLFHNYQISKESIVMQTITVPAGQHIRLDLPDGTAVWLNSRTTLRYPLSFNKKERKVDLDGEAYFEVAPNQKQRFIVQTKRHNVEALGTKFNVEAYNEQSNFITTLMEGKVRIEDSNNSETSLILLPDTKVVFENDKLNIYNVDDYNPYRWREGLICFRNTSFSDIMKGFEKYYGVTVHIDNDQVNKNNYTGKFRQTDGIDYALRVLQRDISFKYKIDDEKQEITIK